ncbi:hypothetical protein [Thioalkalivibrio sp. XN8]|uniref:hypothetical protein n=1 Tax=Thioalkalivibrio sp. XN8 TaxID=2712863 RepID=UPI0013EAE1C0|nr:hypothetical protein [Thioalkalivibrio sp. XN8]NGP53150.1 hypothetical protein [Thioalkalivibrio sp. XN8]
MFRASKTAAALAASLMIAAPALAQDSSGEWRQTIYLYGMGVSIDGEAQIGPVTVEVDKSISDVFDALKFGAMGQYRLENGTWSFSADATYMSLGDRGTGPQGIVGARLNTDQLTVMGTVGRRFSPRLEGLFSLAYFDLSADLRLGAAGQNVSASRDADWVDPLVGLHYTSQLDDNWSLSLRGDIGGFGIGSDLTLHGWATLVRQQTPNFSWYLGYRYISYDYETGSGINFQRYDLSQYGPGAGVAWSF